MTLTMLTRRTLLGAALAVPFIQTTHADATYSGWR